MKTQEILNTTFSNKVIDKHQLKQVIVWAFRNYGIARAANMADKLKDLGFFYATKAGISLSLEDLRIPPAKKKLLATTIKLIEETDSRHKKGEITAVERFQKVIDTWNNASDLLKKEVIKYFKDTDPLNSIYMMAFSGARGNISQVRQLVGMRGLMSDPQGQIIDLPIASNFREGLTITDYFISSYGARKGLVDTALRTADSGYLTRRLVDVAQDVIIRDSDCQTSKGIVLEEMVDNNKTLISLQQALLGRVTAEDVIDPLSNKIIACKGVDITPSLANKITESGLIKNVLVRSPITCNSVRSVCQSCYGWNLAHGQMVDLGEAVGIIAAQSIGEPGTQLTMRTFHTGGVFTGELAQTLVSQEDCKVEYSEDIPMSPTRTRHGDSAMLVHLDCKLRLISSNNNHKVINLMQGSLLLIQNKAFIKEGQVIAEYPLSNRIIKEKAQKSVVADFSGSIHLASLGMEATQSKQHSISSVKQEGILWILSGVVHNMPDNAQLTVRQDQQIHENSIIAQTQLVSRYSGCIHLLERRKKTSDVQISVVTSSKTFTNVKIRIDNVNGNRNYFLEIKENLKFILKVSPNQKIVNNQIIADLISSPYRTKTGGIIKYLDLPVSKKKSDDSRDYYDILSSGYILWIPEETHEINKDVSLLLVKHGDFVDIGTEIIKNIFANNAGVLEVVQKDGIIREIIIKPGKTYQIEEKEINQSLDKHRGFLRPGENIVNGITTDKLVYWEYIKKRDNYIILIRPVIVYSIQNKNISFSYTNDSFATDMLNLKQVKRIYFRDGARVKSVHGVDLVNTHLISQLNPEILGMSCVLELIQDSLDSRHFLLKLSTADILALKDVNNLTNKNFYTQTKIKVKHGQYVLKGSIIAQTEIISSIDGVVECVQEIKKSNRRILIVSRADVRTFTIANNQLIKVSVNDWIYAGEEIATDLKTLYSGKVIAIRDNQISIRVGQPYLISSGSILHINHASLVQRGENIATLIFERAKTGDIIQGLPRIEEILEARKKSENLFNSHEMLESRFSFYLNIGLSLYDATRLSLLDTQLSLVKEVQLVYQSQGVDISDKHIEVIVRQMTSKVKIENGGATEYLPGEMIELQKIESINQSLSLINKDLASYRPILLGITKASLNTESFISAASFQETTKVLTEAAISGKLDWLRGLKENVIIGRLIPAGTGFNMYSNPLSKNSTCILARKLETLKQGNSNISDLKSNFEDIIVDDRNILGPSDFVDIDLNSIKTKSGYDHI
nr:RNA polymerase beta'' subunit [Gloiopeltis furcata]